MAVARRVPVQQRSIESMNRMLDAGEQLFYEGGSPALTLEAVIERAETSTGSFYARFGDMRGFLDAMHERVLGLILTESMPVLAKASMEKDLESALRTICVGVFDVTKRHRSQVYFFAVGNNQDETWRAMGAQFMLQHVDTFGQIVKPYLTQPTSAATKRRIDMAARTILAAMFQQVMFDQDEISRLDLSPKLVATELATMINCYLTTPPGK